MNFFASVFADDPDRPSPKSELESGFPNIKDQPLHEQNPDSASSSNQNPNPSPSGAGAWSFGGLIKTLSTKSESVLETYRRDLREFGSGLKKELQVAQGSMGAVSTVIDEFGNTVLKSTAQIKEVILSADHESDSSDSNNLNNQSNSLQQRRYNRFDVQLSAIQLNVNSYCEAVDDLDAYNKWKSGFDLDGTNEEIDHLFAENGEMENIYRTVVPNNVDHETFWCRYFYRVFKLKQAEDLRANLVKRAITREDEEEELNWDVDDDEDENESASNVVAEVKSKDNGYVSSKTSGDVSEGDDVTEKTETSKNKELGDKESEKIVEENLLGDDEGEKMAKSNVDADCKGSVVESNVDNVVSEKVSTEKSNGMNKENSGEEKVNLMGEAEPGESSKDSDFSIVSSQSPMPEEEDLGWDEIEDLSSIEEKKVNQGGGPDRAELKKRLSVAEEEEDLSWDIEDDDDEPQPSKA